MPANITVSHASPLLNYIPRSTWALVAGSGNGSSVPSNGSYHVTNGTSSQNASFAFSWWGTGIWIYGVPLADSGPYQVVLDNDVQVFDVYPGGTSQLGVPTLIFGASDLPLDQHEIRVVNTGSSSGAASLAVDHLVFESQLENNTTIEHTSMLCTWAPTTGNAWEVDETSHTTSLTSGRMSMNFTGAGIAIYGDLQAFSAAFGVTVDGHTDPPYIPNVGYSQGYIDNGFNVNQSAPVLLYANMNLRQGTHTMLLENNPISASATVMSISYGVVYSDDSSPSSGSGTAPTVSTSPDLQSKRTKILFSVCFGFLGLLFLSIAIWRLLIIYRRRTASLTDEVTARPFLAPSTSTPPASITTFGASAASPANARDPTSPGMVHAGGGSRVHWSRSHYVILPPREKEVLSPTFVSGTRGASPAAIAQTRPQPLRRAPEFPSQPQDEDENPQVREATSLRRSAFHSLAVAAADRERKRIPDDQASPLVSVRGEANAASPSSSGSAQPRPPENRVRILARRQVVLGAGPSGASSAFWARARPPRTPPELRMGATDPPGGWVWDMQMPPPYRTIDLH
ncbi:hypothetical protein FKP32DRAFT_1596389 [Trametes sanguinea]|nr:hypothetical protein FKP32DRAFT_1596389 [Trametes sanguinea]